MSIDNIREILGGPDDSGRLPAWKSDTFVGQVELFNGNQVHKVNVVGMGPTPDSIQLATHDTWNLQKRISRMLVMSSMQAPAVLQGLLDSEMRIVDLEATAPEAWPELPLVLAEAECHQSTVKVMVDNYKDRLEVKLTKTSPSGRNGQWLKWSPKATRQMMRLILEAYDSIEATSTNTDPDADDATEDDGLF